MPQHYDAVVVGSGPNGLAAAITLAREGLGVLVCEASATIGGGARSAELTLPGFVHDVCSAIHPMAIASPLFRELPLHEHGLSWIHPEIPAAHPLEDGSAALLERSLDETARGLGADETAFRRLLGPLLARGEGFLDEILAPPLGLLRRPLALLRFGPAALRSADGLARAKFRTEAARSLFAGNAAHSVLPLEAPASAAIGLVLTLAGLGGGWPLPRGGSGRISAALSAHLESLGGKIVTGQPIRSLGDLPSHRAALFDLSPGAVAEIAGDRLPGRYVERLRRFRHGPGVFKLDWALDGPVPWTAEVCRRAGTVHVGGSLAAIAASERAVWNGEHAERPFVLVAQPSLFDPTRAPEGRHTLWGYCHVPSGSTEDMTGRIEAQIERFAPGFRERILQRHRMTATQMEAYNPNYVGGDITGGVNDLRQLLARPAARPTPYATPDRRLYICSASTPPGGGVHGMCGHHAARAALSRCFGIRT